MRRQMRAAVVLGLCVGLACAGLLWLLSRLHVASFVPLDIANAVIEVTPGQVATTTIETLGEWGKRLLMISGVVGFVVAFGVLGGLVRWLGLRFGAEQRGRWLGLGAGLALVALLITLLLQYGVPANAASIPAGAVPPLMLALVYGVAGAALGAMVHGLERRSAVPVSAERRTFLLGTGGAALGLALGGGALGALIPAGSAEEALALPTPVPPTAVPSATVEVTTVAPSVTAGGATITPAPTALPTATPLPAFVAAASTRSEITQQEFLYVISSSTRDPIVRRTAWQLKVTGAVKQPYTITYDELLALPRHDQTSTLECISNEVGNFLIGNCNWNGVLLKDLIARAEPLDGVVDVVFRAAEGYSDSVPLAVALDPNSLVAYGIDGQPLAEKHGFPARVRIPGIYGMKNVKWLTEIELVQRDHQGYWQQRGWTDDATVFTTSVFDTANPRTTNGELKQENGVVALGGIAFAGQRGIRKVEVRVDDGPWQEARLKEVASDITWRLWRYDWTAQPGSYTLAVRATDGTGEVQTEKVQDTHPDGATGYHTIKVTVV